MTEQLKKEIIQLKKEITHLLANGKIELDDIPCLKNDKEVVIEAVKQCAFDLEFASKELRANKEVVLVAAMILWGAAIS